MLIDLMTGSEIKKVPFEKEFKLFMSRMTPDEISKIYLQLDSLIEGTEIHTAGWLPGSDWTSTVYEPIYIRAAKQNMELAAKCFGLIVWDVFMRRPEIWSSGHFESNGVAIGSRTYFLVKK